VRCAIVARAVAFMASDLCPLAPDGAGFAFPKKSSDARRSLEWAQAQLQEVDASPALAARKRKHLERTKGRESCARHEMNHAARIERMMDGEVEADR